MERIRAICAASLDQRGNDLVVGRLHASRKGGIIMQAF